MTPGNGTTDDTRSGDLARLYVYLARIGRGIVRHLEEAAAMPAGGRPTPAWTVVAPLDAVAGWLALGLLELTGSETRALFADFKLGEASAMDSDAANGLPDTMRTELLFAAGVIARLYCDAPDRLDRLVTGAGNRH